MARVKTSIAFGRFVFLALMTMQCFFLASFLAHYEDEGDWYAVSLLFVPAAVMWWWINSSTADQSEVVIFWLVYSWLGAVPLIGIVFGRLDDKIESEGFWNASTLKLTLCITPLLLLLLCHTRIATKSHDVRFSEWSAKALINLFDGIELIAVILDENECSHGISRHFKNTLIAFTCMSLLWSPVDISVALQPEAAAGSDYEVLSLLSYFIQVLLDTIFFGLRLGLCLAYGRNASIFISKNIISIAFHWRRICNILCCLADDSNVSRQQAEPSEHSTPAMSRPALLPNPTRIINVLGFSSPSVSPREPTAPPPPYNPATNYEV